VNGQARKGADVPESLDVAVRATAVLGEGPTWDDAAGTGQPGHPFAG